MSEVEEKRGGFTIFIEDGKAVRVEDFGLPLVEELSWEHFKPFVELVLKSMERDALAAESLAV